MNIVNYIILIIIIIICAYYTRRTNIINNKRQQLIKRDKYSINLHTIRPDVPKIMNIKINGNVIIENHNYTMKFKMYYNNNEIKHDTYGFRIYDTIAMLNNLNMTFDQIGVYKIIFTHSIKKYTKTIIFIVK